MVVVIRRVLTNQMQGLYGAQQQQQMHCPRRHQVHGYHNSSDID